MLRPAYRFYRPQGGKIKYYDIKRNDHRSRPPGDGACAVAGDGQVTLGEKTIMKGTARKVRRLYNGNVVVGLRGLRSGCFHAVRMVRRKVDPIQRQPEAGSGESGEGLAGG